MNKFTCLLLLIFPMYLVAQDSTHVIKNYKSGKLEEDYYLNASGNKNGTYLRYTRYGKLYIVGQYKDGTPVGTWNYYSGDTMGDLVQTLNFDTHKETFCDTNRINSLICGPRYFGGNMLKQEYVQYRIKTDFATEERNMLRGKSVLVVFEIDSATYLPYGISVEDQAISPDLKAKMVKIIMEMPAWLPPACTSGTPVWRMSVVFLFQ